MRVKLRPITDHDDAFLRKLYASTRASELTLVAWSPEQKDAFVTQQFEAQQHHYREHYNDASFDIVELDGKPIGRLYVDRSEDEIRIVDIALVPESRNQGLGSSLMRSLLEEARETGKRATIHVELGNPARRFYERLGFAIAQDDGVHVLMEWTTADG